MRTVALAIAVSVVGGLSSLAWAVAQPAAPVAPAATAGTTVAQAPRAAASRSAAAPAGRRNDPSRSGWTELGTQQQQALAPLAGIWGQLSAAQKRKWLALSQNYPRMPAAEQAKLHSRMAEWATLSPQQRAQARLNFAETRQLAPNDKKAMWEAYQALPPEEKRRLAGANETKTLPNTAAAVRPVPPQKLATVPPPNRDARSPRIATAPAEGTTLQGSGGAGLDAGGPN